MKIPYKKTIGASLNKARSYSTIVNPVILGIVLFLIAVGMIMTETILAVPGDLLIVLDIAVVWTLYSLLVLGLNLEFGFAGLINFGHLVFYLIGAYTFAIITGGAGTGGMGLSYHWTVGLVFAILIAGLFGAIIGSTSFRLRGDFLAIVTLAALEVMLNLVNSFTDITGGASGMHSLPTIGNLIPDTGTTFVMSFILFASAVALSYALINHITSSPFGRVLRAIRSDELVPLTLGKNTFKYKMQIFVIGSMIAGLAGTMLVAYHGAISPDYFVLDETIIVWVGMFIGGIANNRGVLAGVGIILFIQLGTRYLNETFSSIPDFQFGAFRMILIGLILVVVIRYEPGGIWGETEEVGV